WGDDADGIERSTDGAVRPQPEIPRVPLIGGVDGCKAGWLLLCFETETRVIQPEIVPHAAGLVGRVSQLGVLTVDIPIGLTDGPARQCDVEARRLLGPGRGSSVFPAPVRAALGASDYL